MEESLDERGYLVEAKDVDVTDYNVLDKNKDTDTYELDKVEINGIKTNELKSISHEEMIELFKRFNSGEIEIKEEECMPDRYTLFFMFTIITP